MQLPLLHKPELGDREFARISALVYEIAGIALPAHKKELVKARLSKRLRALGLDSWRSYLAYLSSDNGARELVNMLDAISTNLTSFLREPMHFQYLDTEILPRIFERPDAKIRIWSAGCSTGEEAYTIGICLHKHLAVTGARDAKILATDINTLVLGYAAKGEYPQTRLNNVSRGMLQRYFDCIQTRPTRTYRVKQEIRERVAFARLNLLDRWPMHGPFDVIFCRNVMIYFDKPTQQKLVSRFGELLRPGGTLFIGHSESLTGIDHKFKYQKPTIYRKI